MEVAPATVPILSSCIRNYPQPGSSDSATSAANIRNSTHHGGSGFRNTCDTRAIEQLRHPSPLI